MTLDSFDKPDEPRWLTLTEAAARSGYTREALRLRVRRAIKKGTLSVQRGNDGTTRVEVQWVDDLPPWGKADGDRDVSMDDRGDDEADDFPVTLVALQATMDDLRKARTDLDKAQADRLDAHGRAERAEAGKEASDRRADEAERRAAAAEAALAEARTPWVVRVVRAFRGS
jgi:hypothetical protein